MRIRDVREDKDYNQNFLNNKDKEFLRGFDWCMEMAVDNFFYNLECLESDHIEKFFSEKLPEYWDDEYCFQARYGEMDFRKVETYGDYFRMKLLQWVESSRNELVTSMIDEMDDDEYEKIRAKYEKEE